MSISKWISLALFLALASAQSCPSRVNLAIGSYTIVWWLPTVNGSGLTYATLTSSGVKQVMIVPPKIIGEDPEYCTIGRNQALYCASKLKNSTIVRLALDGSVTSAKSPLKSAAHLEVLPASGRYQGERIVTAHYGNGGVTSFLRKGKYYKNDTFVVPEKFASFDQGQQKAPHPHHVLPIGNGDVVVCDLGSDYVWRFGIGFDGSLHPKGGLKMRLGDGPRHAARGPRGDVYVVNELSNTVSRVMGCGGGLRECERFNLLDGKNKTVSGISSAAIRVTKDGKFLYASVRRPEKELGSIVGFELSNGAIKRKIGEWSSHGVHPRDFNIIENGPDCKSFVAITNMNSDNLVFVERNKVTGVFSSKVFSEMTVYTPTSVLEVNAIPDLTCALGKVPPKVMGTWGSKGSSLWWAQFKIWRTRKMFCLKCRHLC